MTQTSNKSTWPSLPIGNLLTRVVRPVDVDEAETYQEIGIRSHCKGIFHKPPVTGSDLGDKRVFWVEPGCLVFNIIFAWEQAVAVTSDAEKGMIASHRFPMYRGNGQLLPEYAYLFFCSPMGKHLLNIASPGGAGRNKTLGQEEFKRLAIPVPPIDYQQLTVNAHKTWDHAIRCLQTLITARRRLAQGLAQELLTGARRLPGFNEPWVNVKLNDIASINPPTSRPPSPDTEVTFLTMADIAERGGLLKQQVRKYEEVCNGFTKFQDGDILIAKITPCYENGKGALLSGLKNGLGFGTTELHVVRPRPESCPLFLYYVTMSRPFRTRGIANMTGSAGQKRVPADFIRHYRFDCPPLDEQRQIASVLGIANQGIALLERKLALLVKQKRGLMQQLCDKGIKAKV